MVYNDHQITATRGDSRPIERYFFGLLENDKCAPDMKCNAMNISLLANYYKYN